MPTLQERIKDAAENSNVSFRNSYSGRGMYGKSCVGIVSSHDACMSIISQIIREDADELIDSAFDAENDDRAIINIMRHEWHENVYTLLRFSTDSMGHDVIFYWPELESIDETEYEVEDEV